MTIKYCLIPLLFCIVFKSTCVLSTPKPIIFTNTTEPLRIGEYVSIFEDKNNTLSLNDVLKSVEFKQSTKDVPNLGVTKSCFWIKFSISNKSSSPNLLLEVAQPTISDISLYKLIKNNQYEEQNEGLFKSFYDRIYQNQNYLFNIDIPCGEIRTYYLKINSRDQVMLPIYIGSPKIIFESLTKKDLLFGLFIGTMIVMALYNIFVFFTIRDRVYLYYVLYILLIILVQSSLQGYAFRFLWPKNIQLAKICIFIFPALANISAILFTKSFLKISTIVPKLNMIFGLIISIFLFDIVIAFIGLYTASFIILQLSTILGSLILFFSSAYITFNKGYRPAKFFLLSWSFLLLCAIIFVLKDFAILPYNTFTSNSLQIGSALEVILLSFALADKINIYKKEKEISQAETLKAVQETARITTEQNIILEAKVIERTVELQTSNTELNKALVDLKEAESQLVEAEKMASLGQLTAGIAHEINNPINFVTSNVAPLKRDVDMLIDAITTIEEVGLSEDSIEEKQDRIEEYKEEIDFDYLKIEIGHLLKGIHEGASRTAEIVKGLRVFSRLDEDDLKKADINEGLESTLVIANNLLNNKIKLVKQYGNMPFVECYPGKLNQVFLNIISNGIYAIKKKYEDVAGGVLEIATYCDEKNVYIKIKDNGIGMDETTKKKIFEPFFTTKPVGEGTGLGMSITYNTIKKHNGQIHINSTLGIGTEFIIELRLQMD